MLRRELPETEVHELPSYKVTYRSKNMTWNVARQSLHWLRTIRAEQLVVADLVKRLGIDRIVSDSRFGCHHSAVESVFVTHQLHPITHFAPASSAYAWQLRHFDKFWVPDHAGHDRLSGKLSDPAGYENVEFIGPLSHLSPVPDAETFDLLILLSGPEPARTQLENLLLPQLDALDLDHRLVQGLPGGQIVHRISYIVHRTSYPYADTPTLSRLLTGARYVVARSGYSTLMDLRALGKPAVLIPTPGQTEQEYLAQRAQLRGWAVAAKQKNLDLAAAIDRLRSITASLELG